MFITEHENRFFRRHPSWRPARIAFKTTGDDVGAGSGGSNSGSGNAGAGTGAGTGQDQGTPPDKNGGSSTSDDQSSSDDDDDDDDELELTPSQQKKFDRALQKRLDRLERKKEREKEREKNEAETARLRNEKKWEELVKAQTTELEGLRKKADSYDKFVEVNGPLLDAEIAKWPKTARGVFTDDMDFEEKYLLAQRVRPMAISLMTGTGQSGSNGNNGSNEDDPPKDTSANHRDPKAAGAFGSAADEEAARKEHNRAYRGF